MENLTRPPYGRSSVVCRHVRFAVLDTRPVQRRRRDPCPGRARRHRPPSRRAQRLCARAGSAVDAAGDVRLRPAGARHRRQPAGIAARHGGRHPPGGRGPAGGRADRPGAAGAVAVGRGAGAARGDRRLHRRQAVPGLGRDLSGHAVVLPGFGVRRDLDAARRQRRADRLRQQRHLPARRARQGRHRGPIRRPRRIQVRGKPFHRTRLHRGAPRGRHSGCWTASRNRCGRR